MDKKINPKISALLVILAGVLWGVTSIFVKGLDSFGLNSMEIGVLRTGICTALILCSIVFLNIRRKNNAN